MTLSTCSTRIIRLAILLCASESSAQQFRGGPDHLGVYESPAPTLQALAWKFKTNGRVISSPLVVGDVVYVGSTDGGLYAVNRADGKQTWRFATRGPISSSPAMHNGLVYISSLDGNVYSTARASRRSTARQAR